jgi:phenylpropionate dioxygenase-like ring-hydroxylating dioxygenase large terminal subunit/AcrR family transcriptional regulator
MTDAARHAIPEAEGRQDRRQQLIDATMEAIRQFGLSRVTVAKVAGLAGLSPGIVSFYFQGKEQLLLETLRSIAGEYEAALRGALDKARGAEESLLAIVDVNLDEHILNPRTASVWYGFWGESQARADYLRIFGARDAAMQERISTLFEELGTQCDRPSMNARAVARAFDALIDSFWEVCMAEGEGFDRQVARETCVAYLQSVFPGQFRGAMKPANEDESKDRRAAVTGQASDGMLAAWTYRNAELFDIEMDTLFKRTWLLAGHVSELPKSGDYVTFEAAGERALVLRDATGTLRAFHNVCRHRGSRVVEGERGHCRRAIVCPFHGWTYNLDGSLKNIPAIDTFNGIDKTLHGLVPLALEVWQGFVFVRFAGDGPSLAEQMKPVEHMVAPYRMEELVPRSDRYRTECDYNWKIIHDVDNEGYHVPMAHPSLQQLYGKSYQDLETGGVVYSTGIVDTDPARLWSVDKYKKLLPEFDHLPAENQRLWLYVGVFPNLVFAIYPDMIEFYMTLPISVGRTALVGRSYALPDDRREVRVSRYLCNRINMLTDKEDRNLCKWLQEGVRSSVFPRDMLSDLEHGVVGFHRRLKKQIPVARLLEEPSAGRVTEINRTMSAS